MLKTVISACAALAVLAAAPSALAAGMTMSGSDKGTMMAGDAGRTLPEICTRNAMPSASGGMGAMPMGNMDKAHEAMMSGMQAMNDHMAAGMTAANLDVAFVCGMIPHHQGAIDMAKAELQYGKDPFARKLAEGIITAQEKEIAEMLDWVKKQTK